MCVDDILYFCDYRTTYASIIRIPRSGVECSAPVSSVVSVHDALVQMNGLRADRRETRAEEWSPGRGGFRPVRRVPNCEVPVHYCTAVAKSEHSSSGMRSIHVVPPKTQDFERDEEECMVLKTP